MAIKFFKFKRLVNINGTSVVKYIPKIQEEVRVGIEELAEIIERKSSFSRGDILGLFAEMETTALWMLENGHPVTLRLFGSYFPAIEAMAVDTPEEVTPKTIKRFKCIYKPSVYMKKRFKNIEFVLGDNLVREVKYKKE